MGYGEVLAKLTEINETIKDLRVILDVRRPMGGAEWTGMEKQLLVSNDVVSSFTKEWVSSGFPRSDGLEPVDLEVVSGSLNINSFRKIIVRLSLDEACLLHLGNLQSLMALIIEKAKVDGAESKGTAEKAAMALNRLVGFVEGESAMLSNWIERANLYYSIQQNKRMYRLQFIIIALAAIAIVAPFGPPILHWLGLT